ncbi:glycosyltransferase family 2 protein [Methanobrevibacter sp. DSM 116169]|uniref:glycosyltransferase family 2 protein n=1 Tax=Methanobrevibacter sp. DSM 116169 TaxID=3242727 RepID=UPI0038FC004F
MSYLISVIIPVYNTEKYLRQCLDSVVNQTLGIENIEVIIVNDCTTDNSMEIVYEYADKYDSFKIIELEENQGLGNARNVGLKEVSSDFINFLDSDDYISDDTYENSLKKIKDNDCDLLVYNSQFFSNDSKNIPLDLHQLNIKEDKIINNLKEFPQLIFLVSAWNKIFTKKLAKFLDFPSGYYEDNIAILNTILNSNKIYLNSEVKYYYRRSGDDSSISTSISLKNCLDLCNIVFNIFKLKKEHFDYSKYLNILALKYTNDILFWIFHYDWYIGEEKEVLDKIRRFIDEFSIEDFKTFKSFKPDYLYDEELLNLNKYDNETFLAKFKYFDNLAYVNSIANLYIDNGKGFNENDKIAIKYELKRHNKISFDLSNFENIVNLRFDPIEQVFIKCKIVNIESNKNNINIQDSNSLNSLNDETQVFTTLDPCYILDIGDDKNISNITFEFELNILNKLDLNNLFNEKDNIINKLNQENNILREKSSKSKNSFLGLIKR